MAVATENTIFPGHEPDQRILAERKLSAGGGRSVRNDVSRSDSLALLHNGSLIDAGSLIAPDELLQAVGIPGIVVIPDYNLLGCGAFHYAVFLGQHADAGVHRGLALHSRTDNRRLRNQQRHCLTLHVRTHQGAVRVVILQERNHGGRDGEYHLPRS